MRVFFDKCVTLEVVEKRTSVTILQRLRSGRPEDVPPLINFFLNSYNKKYKKDISISPEAVDILARFSRRTV